MTVGIAGFLNGRGFGSTARFLLAQRENDQREPLPPELSWREWKGRIEAVLFAEARPVTRDVLARVVGRD